MSAAIGIDVGPSGLRAVVVGSLPRERERRSGRSAALCAKLLAAREAPCDPTDSAALTQALTQLRRTLSIRTPIVLALPGTSAILASVAPLIVAPERATLAVRFELQQQLPFALEDAAWHYRWHSRENGHGSSAAGALPQPPHEPRAVASAVRRSMLEDRLASCHRAGLTVRAVTVSPLATLNLWYAARPSPASAHAVLLRVMSDHLGEWVVASPHSLQVIPVLSDSPELFAQEVAAAWEALASQAPGMRDAPITMLGWSAHAGSASAGIGMAADEAVAAQCGVARQPFQVGDVVECGPVRLEPAGAWSGAVGAALQGLGAVRMPLNLLADVQEAARSRRARGVALLLSLGLGLAGVALGAGTLQIVFARHARVLATLGEQERHYQQLRPEIRSLLQRQQRTEELMRQFEQLRTQASLLPQVLVQVTGALPETAWLTRFECTKTGMIDGVLEGRGRSFQDVTQLLERLKTTAGMTTVKPLSGTTVMTDPPSGKEVVAFMVQVQRPLDPQQEAAEARPSMASSTAGAGLATPPKPRAGARRAPGEPAVDARRPAPTHRY